MATFKERAIAGLQGMQSNSHGLVYATICACIQLVQNVPDDEHSGEKTCRPDYEKKCEELRAKLEEMTSEKNEAEMMMQEAYQEIRNLKSTVARLEGFRDGVILGINARNQIETAKELRNRCNRMEDMNYE